MMRGLFRFLPAIREARRRFKNRRKKQEAVKSINLFQLPVLVLEIIFRQMESIDLFNLSTCSKRATRVITTIAKKNNADSCTIYLRARRPCIKIKFFGFREPLYWVFDKDPEATRGETQIDQPVSGYPFKTFHDRMNPPMITCSNENVLEGFRKILEHFYCLFPVTLKIVVQPDVGDLLAMFKSPLLAKCSELELTRGIQESHFFGYATLTVIFRYIQVKDKFKSLVDTGYARLRPLFTVTNFNIYNGAWMCDHDLARLDCKRGKIRRHSFTNFDIDYLAVQWMKKPIAPRLERLEIVWDPLIPFEFYNLEMIGWDATKRSKRCLKTDMVTSGTYDCSEAYDILREDGLLASVGIVHTSEHESILLFNVWHDRFPTKPHHDLLQKKLVDLRNQLPSINTQYGVGNDAEYQLLNPNLSLEEFQDMVTDEYNRRLVESGSSPQLDHWFDFHNQVLNVMEEIRQFD